MLTFIRNGTIGRRKQGGVLISTTDYRKFDLGEVEVERKIFLALRPMERQPHPVAIEEV